ncbi:unnamed protein product [Caenorhabditis auriculariae]|uniref:RNA-binding protein pno-1 n=1 Tax=Caenorhabditis auriculariae TaxID=2777116 RepID=A0A8S1HHA4_9PELO|nr:unnamed protein product [Caenorhabditis auriculariae]
MRNFLKDVALKRCIEALYTGGSVEWSPNGKKLFSTCSNVVKVIDLENNLANFTIGDVEEELRITCICIDKNRNNLLVAYNNQIIREFSIPLQENKKPEVIRSWKSMHNAPILVMQFDEKGVSLATGSADNSVKVWNLEKQQCTHTLKGPAVVSSISFVNIDRLVVGYIEGQLLLFDLVRGSPKKVLHEWKNHTSQITSVLQIPHTRKVVALSRDQTVSIHETETLETVKVLPLFEAIESASIAHNGNLITVGEEGVLKEWVVDTAKLVRKKKITSSRLDSVSYNALTNRCLIVSAEENLYVVNYEELQISRQIVGFHDEIYSCCFIGKRESHIAVASNTSEIRVYNLQTLDCQLIRGHSESVLTIAPSPWDSNLLASCSKDNSIIVWKFLEGEETSTLTPLAMATGHANTVTSICMSNGGKSPFLTSVSTDCTIKIWPLGDLKVNTKFDIEHDDFESLPKLTCTSTLVAHAKDVNCVSIAETDSVIATGGMDKMVKLWQVDLGKMQLGIGGSLSGHKRSVGDVKFARNSHKLASCSGDMTIKVWSVPDKTCLQTLVGHPSAVFRIIFLNNDFQILSADSGGILKIWTLKNGECEASFDAHTDKIWSLDTNSEESEFVTAGSDGRIAIWKDVTTEKQAIEDRKRKETLEQEQTLVNLLDQNRHQEALEYALTLIRPSCALKVINLLMDANEVGKAVEKLDDRNTKVLLDFATQWNTNSRSAQAAQRVFYEILMVRPPEYFTQMSNSRGIVESLIPYTKRHLDRLSRARQDSAMLEFVWKQMRIDSGSLSSHLANMSNKKSAAIVIDDDLPMEEGVPDLIEEDELPLKMPSLIEQNTGKKEEEFTLVKRKRKSAAKDEVMEDVSEEAATAAFEEGEMPEGEDVPMETSADKEGPSKKRSKGVKGELRVVPVPRHRYTPLKDNWVNIFTPVVKNLGLQIRFNLKKRQVEIRNPEDREDTTDLQKACDFVKAFVLGFEVNDALALIRLDHLFLETFEIADVKASLKGDHVSRAIGRIAGKDGRTKLVIENTTKTRIVLADTKIHLLGAYQNLKLARNAISSLILGANPSKVYGTLRSMASRGSERL